MSPHPLSQASSLTWDWNWDCGCLFLWLSLEGTKGLEVCGEVAQGLPKAQGLGLGLRGGQGPSRPVIYEEEL